MCVLKRVMFCLCWLVRTITSLKTRGGGFLRVFSYLCLIVSKNKNSLHLALDLTQQLFLTHKPNLN